MFLPPEVVDWPLNVAVVRSGGQTILIDSGLGLEFPDFPRAGQLALRLEAAGIAPSSVTDVVLTHLHMDHVGGLLSAGLRDRLRPDLRIHLASAEAEFWAAPDFSRTVMPKPIPDVLRAVASKFLDVYRGQLRPLRDGVRGGAGGQGVSDRRPHPWPQHRPPGVRRRPTDLCRRRRVRARVR